MSLVKLFFSKGHITTLLLTIILLLFSFWTIHSQVMPNTNDHTKQTNNSHILESDVEKEYYKERDDYYESYEESIPFIILSSENINIIFLVIFSFISLDFIKNFFDDIYLYLKLNKKKLRYYYLNIYIILTIIYISFLILIILIESVLASILGFEFYWDLEVIYMILNLILCYAYTLVFLFLISSFFNRSIGMLVFASISICFPILKNLSQDNVFHKFYPFTYYFDFNPTFDIYLVFYVIYILLFSVIVLLIQRWKHEKKIPKYSIDFTL